MSVPHFRRVALGNLENASGHAPMNTLLTLGDINQDGLIDVVVAGRNGSMAWFENPGQGTTWTLHLVGTIQHLECGGLTFDLTGSGYPDIIDGGDSSSDELAWWENPGPRGGPWTRHLIAKTGAMQFHNVLIDDITNEGRPSLLFANQGSGSLYWAPLPANPFVSPWPAIQLIATDLYEWVSVGKRQAEEGMVVADIDGDGKNEVVAGTHWFKYTGHSAHPWEQHKFASDYITTLVVAGDIDGDGRLELVLSEGDACIYGKPQGGKLAWFKPGEDITALWEEHLLAEHLLDPHSLQLGNICGNGHLDLLVGEIGVKETFLEQKPRLQIFENDGRGQFTPHVIDQGTGTHHAHLVDLRKRGVLDIVSRPLHGPEKWQIFAWYNEGHAPHHQQSGETAQGVAL